MDQRATPYTTNRSASTQDKQSTTDAQPTPLQTLIKFADATYADLSRLRAKAERAFFRVFFAEDE